MRALAFAEEFPWSGVGEVDETAGRGLSGGDLFVIDLGHVDCLGGGEMGEVGVRRCW